MSTRGGFLLTAAAGPGAGRGAGTVLPLLLLLAATAASAQEGDASARPFELGLQASFVPVYGGDATVGPITAWAGTARAGLRLGPVTSVELVASLLPRDDDPYHRVPGIGYYDALFRFRFTRPDLPVEAFFSVGYSLIRYDVHEIVCRPEDGCIDEGGPGFDDGSTWVPVFGLGYSTPLAGRIRWISDLRWHIGGDAGVLIGTGVAIRL